MDYFFITLRSQEGITFFKRQFRSLFHFYLSKSHAHAPARTQGIKTRKKILYLLTELRIRKPSQRLKRIAVDPRRPYFVWLAFLFLCTDLCICGCRE